MRLASFWGFLGLWLAPLPAMAATIEIGPMDDLRAEVGNLQPGDELVLRGGTYNLGSRFSIGVSGTEQQPIVIRSKDGETATITRPDAGQNTINIENASYVTLRGLEIRGGSHGVRMMDSNFITIEDCEIHETGDVALSANIGGNSYEGLIFRRNHVHHTGGTGEGFYLGCNDADCVMSNSLIEGNYIHDTLGTNQGDGIEIKHGSWGNIIRDNVIHDTNYPCILVYGTEGNPRNIIERNVMWGCGDHGIQAAADAIIRNNIILSANSNGIHNQVHQGATPGNLEIVHNTVIAQNDALRTNDIADTVIVANNALYSQGGNAFRAGGNMAMLTAMGNVVSGNAPSAGFDPSGNILQDFEDLAYSPVKFGAYPAAGSSLINAGVAMYAAADDFDGTSRNGEAHVGAYHYSAGGPASPLGPGFKGQTPGGSGGLPGTGGGGQGSGGTAATGGGATASGGGPGSAGASGGVGIDDDGGMGSGDDGGCACRSSTGTGSSLPSLLGLLLLPLLVRLRRRGV